MARKSKGQAIRTHTGRGHGWAIRLHAYGERRYLTLGDEADGWTEAKAQAELALILAAVRLGRWQPEVEPTAPPARGEPTFHRFASEWFASVEHDLRASTVADYRWQLTEHLLPFFADHRLTEITVQEVDRYRDAQVREGRLSAESINKTLTRLGQILERAFEYELVDRNPVKVGRRKLKTSRVSRSYLDDAAQITDLLDAAAELDREARADRRHVPRRALIATLALAGLRIGELLALRWRDVDLAGGRLRVGDSKTDAGVRHVTVQPALLDELKALKAKVPDTGPDAFVFAAASGRAIGGDNVRNRTFAAAVKRANERRAERDLPPLPRITPHSLRRTYISALLALGYEVPVVMAEVGHRDPKVTLGIYAQVMRRDEDARARLRALLVGESVAADALNVGDARVGTHR